MPLTIIVDNIANFSKNIEAVVNLCHPTPGQVGTGVDAVIHKKVGEKLRSGWRAVVCLFGEVRLKCNLKDYGISEEQLIIYRK